MRKDGSAKRRLIAGPGGHPAWSPDGRTIAFERGGGVNDEWVAPTPDGPTNIWLMAADGSNQRPLTNPGTDTTPRWSPDGHRIVFTRNDDLYVIGADGKGLHQLTRSGQASSPVWSPDGSAIAFVKDSREPGSNRTIVAINADGTGHTRPLTSPATDAIQPSWSPDSKKLTFTVLTDTCSDLGACIMGFGGKAWSIHTINSDGTGDRQLTEGSDSAPAWQPAPATPSPRGAR